MFEGRLQQGQLLKKVAEAVKDLCKEVVFDVKADTGLTLEAMDASNVTLVSLLLRETAFTVFRCDKPTQICLSVESLVRVGKFIGDKEMLTIQAESKSEKVHFMVENPETNRTWDFSVPQLVREGEHFGVPEQSYAATMKVKANEWQRITRDLSSMGEVVKLAADKEKVTLVVSGDGADITGTLKPGADMELTCEEPVEASFALRYLAIFAKATPLCETVQISLKADMPLCVDYGLGAEGSELVDTQQPERHGAGYLRFYLAPKIEEE
mmetsp:Transcript_39302/g.94514  ORF Transcript_39302/g.94514 Transcript_39302/m.94514 type:complete len:268 (-) Transcript_39302:131-934(-)